MTSAGALTVCPASPVDSPAASAPSPGNTSDSPGFRQQLRDAHESIGSHEDDNASAGNSGPKRAAARGPEKRGLRDGEAKVPVLVPAPAQPGPVLPLSLDFALMPVGDGELTPGTDREGTASADSQNGGAPQGGANSADNLKDDIALAAAPNLVSDSQTGAPPTELTFAVKLEPHMEASGGQATKDSSKTGQEGISSKLPAPVKSAATAVKAVTETERTEPRPADTPAPRTDAFARIGAFQTNWQNPPSNGPDAAGPTHVEPSKALEAASAVQAPAADATGKSSAPLKELSIQVGQTQQDRVELRVVDRSGEVQVAVRATNPDVAQGLRQGLSELVGRLDQNGYRTEAWRPGGTVTSVQGPGESRQKEMQFQRDGSQSQSGGSQQGRQQSQQNQQNQSYRPRWVQELEGSFSDNSNSNAGEWNGLTN